MRNRPGRVRARLDVRDERFATLCGDDWWDHHFDDGRWTEGPLYVPAGRSVLFSDIPNDRILRWDEHTNRVDELRDRANHANGRTLDRCGRVVTCEQGTRRVVRTEHDGSTTVLADRVAGARLNSPNDVVVSSDESIWFTDPTYGIASDYEGFRSREEIGGRHVYRIAPGDTRPVAVATDFEQPNGLAFSLDERRLYVVDSSHQRNHIRRFDVDDDWQLSGTDVVASSSGGQLDGIRLDTGDRIWAAAGDGIHCLEPDRTLLGKLLLPEPASNLAFGGPKRNRLFVTATRSLYSILLRVNGADTTLRRETTCPTPHGRR